MQRWELSAFDRKHLALVSVPRPVPGPVTRRREGVSNVQSPH
jgi:hypothetical protein